MPIREATRRDEEAVRELYQRAFDADERERVAELAVELLFEETEPPIFSLVAESDGAVAGHVAFSPVTIVAGKKQEQEQEQEQVWMLAPLAVKPDCQGRGLGSELVESGRRKLAEMGAELLLVYGDPAFYGKFGFRAETAERYLPPYELEYPFGWLALVLGEGGLAEGPRGIRCVAPLCDPGLW